MLRLFLALALGASAQAPAPKIAIVIDDFGLNYKTTPPNEEWLKLPFPITVAVMPESPRTKQAAAAAAAAGREVIIHFPFEPFQKLELPKDAASAEDVAKTAKLMEKAFAQIPQAVGLNNHQSYHGTKNRPYMAEVMKLLKGRVKYFLDSAVSPKTVAYDEALKAGIPSVRNHMFLEDKGHFNDRAFAAKMLHRATAQAKRHGHAVIIGHHYYRGTLDAVISEVPKLQKQGFEFVYASALLTQPGEASATASARERKAPRRP